MPTSRIWLLSHVKRAIYCPIHRRNMWPSVVSGENGAGPTPALVGGSFMYRSQYTNGGDVWKIYMCYKQFYYNKYVPKVIYIYIT